MADWFVVNVRDARWWRHHAFGASCRFESRETPFEQLGVNIRVLQPGEPNCLYHSENLQEDFLVLAGECLLLVDGEERPLRAWTSCTARRGRSTCSWAPATGRARSSWRAR